MTRIALVALLVIGIAVVATGTLAHAAELSANVGPPPVIISPEENAWFASNTPVEYCWVLPEGVARADVLGYELQFSDTQTPDGLWRPARFITGNGWYNEAGHEGVWEPLYWRVRIVYYNLDRSPWAMSYYRVGTAPPVVGPPPVITSPEENAWLLCDAPVDYCWSLPEGVAPDDVSGYELEFSDTETPDGPWHAARFFVATCWHYKAGHPKEWAALYWRVRIVYDNNDRSPWATSYHQVGVIIGGAPPVITSPRENAWVPCNTRVDYCWELPEGVAIDDVSGHELEFSDTQTQEGPWDAPRFFTATCWYYVAGHQSVWDALYWRVRIKFDNGDRSPWAISHHRVGTMVPTKRASWGRIKARYE